MKTHTASTELPAPVIRNGRSVEANWALLAKIKNIDIIFFI